MIPAFGEKIVNRASLTWRGMTEAERAARAAHRETEATLARIEAARTDGAAV